MTNQPQRNDSDVQRREDGQLSKARQTTSKLGATLGVEELNYSPKACAMQRLVGHQSKPVRSA